MHPDRRRTGRRIRKARRQAAQLNRAILSLVPPIRSFGRALGHLGRFAEEFAAAFRLLAPPPALRQGALSQAALGSGDHSQTGGEVVSGAHSAADGHAPKSSIYDEPLSFFEEDGDA